MSGRLSEHPRAIPEVCVVPPGGNAQTPAAVSGLARAGLAPLVSAAPPALGSAEPAVPPTRVAGLPRATSMFGDEPSIGADLSWQERALCAQTDPESFFPEKGGSTREAKRVCLSCDVRAECLEYALGNDERFGIWGGLSERERRRLKKLVG